jgi:anaerobic dimethyl sulfoxide reductase subunit A
MEDYQNDGWYGYAPQIQNGTPFGTTSGQIEILTNFFAQTQGLTTGQSVPNAMLPTYGRYYPAVPSYIPAVRGWNDPLAAKYPLTMLTSHSRYRYHSAYWYNPMLNGEVYQHGIWISGVDALARGITSGDLVNVSNDWGTVMGVKAYISNRISPGVVMFHYAAPFKESAPNVDAGGSANSLTGEDISPVTSPRAVVLVEVQPA